MNKDESIRPSTPPEPAAQPPARGETEIRPFLILAAVIAVLFLAGDAIIAHTAPLEHLLQSTPWSTMSTIHGLVGSTIFIAGSIALYLGYRLLVGRLDSVHDLSVATLLTALAALSAVLLGNWLYIGYRQPGMTQDYFAQNIPELHWTFFEFKENIAVFTVPLAVAATFILYRYGSELLGRPWLRTVVFLLLAMVFLFFLITFGLGALITKLKPV